MLPDGAIFCGECGRAVTAAASRRPVAPPPVEQAPPPPLQQPDVHGRREDPAAEAWLPEATLDPATRAWLTGADRHDEQPPAPVPVQRPEAYPPRSAPTHLHTADSGSAARSEQPPIGADLPGTPGQPQQPGIPDVPGAPQRPLEPQRPVEPERPTEPAQPTGPEWPIAPHAPEVPFAPSPAEPPLDPNAYPSAPDGGGALETGPVWDTPMEQPSAPAPAGPSWWIGRAGASSTAGTGADTGTAADTGSGADAGTAADAGAERSTAETADDARSTGTAAVASPPQPGDTAVVEPLVDRRPPRPTPLVTPGSEATTCHVCGHRLEPDDIFCAECGAVRPAVTAAFTGQIVPLPMDRPDWAADDTDDAADDNGDNDGAEQDEPDTDEATTTDAEADETAAPDAGGADQGIDDTPRAPLRPRGAHAVPDAAQNRGPEPFVPPVPGSATLPSSAPSAPDTTAIGVPFAAPLPPLPGATGPALPLPTGDTGPTSSEGDLEDDVDETRIVSKTPTRAPFVLHFSTGERFGVHSTGLVGRLPRPQPGERFDELLTVHDPGKSVSKTHLELGRDGDDLWVSDRFSGNGTVVRHIDGSIRRCEPGRRYRVERGARVDIGEQFFLVQ